MEDSLFGHSLPLLGLQPAQALSLVVVMQVTGALYLHALTKTLSPGLPRLLSALPVLLSNFAAPLLFQRWRNETIIVLVTFNTAWLSSFKAILWALGRSSLASKRLTAGQFIATFLIPLTPIADSPPHRRAQLPILSSRKLIARGVGNFTLLLYIVYLLRDPWRFHPVFRAFLYGLGLYALLSSIMDGPGAAMSQWLGIQVSPHFDAPWLSAGVASFWNRRWDFSAGNALRQLVYEPIAEGRLVAGPSTPPGGPSRGKPEAQQAQQASLKRQLCGSVATFLASGLSHECIFWYLTGKTSGGWWLSYFLVQAPAVAVERAVLGFFKKKGLEIPRILLTAYAVYFQCVVSAALFWGPAEEQGILQRVIDGVKESVMALVAVFTQRGGGGGTQLAMQLGEGIVYVKRVWTDFFDLQR